MSGCFSIRYMPIIPKSLGILFVFSVFYSSCSTDMGMKAPFVSGLEVYQLEADTQAPDSTVFRTFATEFYGDSSFVYSFQPFGVGITTPLLYRHRYNGNCIYHPSDSSAWIFADVGFPHPCHQPRPMYAQIRLRNPAEIMQRFYFRLFYQNTSYGYPTTNQLRDDVPYEENFYGYSSVVSIDLPAGADTQVWIPWRIKSNPRNRRMTEPSVDAPRPGWYEFMVYGTTHPTDSFIVSSWQGVNPFAEIARHPEQKKKCSYLSPGHFRFLFLEEKFDGENDLTLNRYYIPQDHKEKPLCDTCKGIFPRFHSERWTADEFYRGELHRNGFVTADYGNRKEHVRIDQRGIRLTIPSRDDQGRGSKTWGEVIFGQPFLYGKVTIRAKLAQMLNPTGTPNGIIHNIWLFQRDNEEPDPGNPYSYLRNHEGVHRYEIDFEIWSSYGERSLWDDSFLIDYSIVDYMRDSSVILKPGEEKVFGKYTADRKNGKQCNVISPLLPRSFFDSFHTYSIEWRPQFVRFSIDDEEVAFIRPDMARIPNKPMYLWIGSPIYQDGTLYTQSHIPFLEKDKYSIIDYIRIE